jgi:hypothetical protein
MAHATIADVFNSFSRAASQGMDIYSREKKYHLDTELYKQAQDYELLQNKLAQNLAAVDENGQMPFLNKPDEYRKYVEKSMADWREKARNAGNGSRYYNDSLDRMFLQGQTGMQTKIYAAEKQAERQQFLIDLQKNIQNEYNNPDREKGLANALGHRQNAAIQNVLGPEAGMKLENEIVNTFFGKEGAYQDNGTDTVAEGRQTVKTQLDEYERSLRETYNINPDEYIEDKQIKTEAAQRVAEMTIQDRNYNQLDIADEAYKKNLHDIQNRIPGWEDLVAPTVEMFVRGRVEVKAGTEGARRSEYADDKKPAMESMFPWDDVLGKRPGEDLSKAEIDRFTDHLVQLVIDQYYGDARDEEGNRLTLTIPDAYMAMEDFLKAGGMTVPEREFKQWFDNAFIGRIQKEPGSNQAAGFISMLLTNPLSTHTPEAEKVTGYKYDAKYDSENAYQKAAIDQLNADYQNRALNLIANTGLLPGNQKFLKEAIDEMRNAYLGKLTVILDTNMKMGSSSTVQNTGNYKSMAKALEWIEKSPVSQIEDRKGGSPYAMINDDGIIAYKQMAEDYLTDRLNDKGISLADIDRDGRIVTGYDRAGNAYRIRGTEKDMPNNDGEETKRTVLVIEQKTGNGWKEMEELTEAQLGTFEAFLKRLGEGSADPQPPPYDPVTGKRRAGAYVSPNQWRPER